MPDLEEALEAMQQLDNGAADQLDRSRVERWMRSGDLEVQGVAYYILFTGRYASRVQPPFTLADYVALVLPYYERCFREDPQSEWASTRYTAGRDLTGWFIALWNDPNVPRATLDAMKQWIENLYRTSENDVRHALITATLEHLFEHREIAQFFAGWNDDPLLRSAYADALEWSSSEPR